MAAHRSRPSSPTLRKAIEKHKRAAYREAIVEAALNVFGRMGFSEARMQDIAAEAGVSVGTLYNYFESKDSVIASLITHEHEEFRKRAAALEQIQDPLARIRGLLDLTFAYIEERGALMVMAVQSGVLSQHVGDEMLGARESGARSYALELYEGALADAAAAGRIRPDLPPGRLAIVLEGMTTAVMMEWVRSNRAQPLGEQAAFVFDLFMKGAAPR